MNLMRQKLQAIEAERQRLRLGGGLAEIEKQHSKGKLTARERIDKLLDPDSFQEIDLWWGAYRIGFEIDEVEVPGDAVVAGYGEVRGRPIYVWAQDATVLGGTMAEVHMAKIVRVMEKALTERVPIVGIYDSEGMRLPSQVAAHGHCSLGTMMRFQTLSSGVIPQISLIMGPCTGGAALSAMLADFAFMVRNTSYMHVAPPPEGKTGEEIGEARMHSRVSGNCDVLADNDEDCLEKCQELLSFLPQNNTQKPPIVDTGDDPNRQAEDLLDIVPAETSKWFDMRDVIRRVADNGYYLEIKRDYAPNLSVGFARFGGETAGIIANNTIWRGGCEDTSSSDKHGRFTRFCDAFNIPIVYFTDCPAFYPSVEEEQQGILRHGCMVIHSTAEATVPKITLYIRKCFGGANLAMPCNILKTDRMLAWPSVERGVMGAPELASVAYKGRIDRAKTPEEKERIMKEGTKRMQKTVERFSRVTNEDIIDPRQTRPALIRALKVVANKKQERPERKHENINL